MEACVEGSQQQAGRLNIPPPPDEIVTPASQQSTRGFLNKDDVLCRTSHIKSHLN